MSTNERLGGMLVFSICFITCFALFVSFIPSDFLYGGKTYASIHAPTEWNGIDIQSFSETKSFILNSSATIEVYAFSIGGRNLELGADYAPSYVDLHQKYGFGLWWDEPMDWYNRQGVTTQYVDWVTKDELLIDYQTHGNIKFVVKAWENQPFQVTALFSFNTSEYTTPYLAWTANELQLLIGINFDDTATAYNAWELIGRILLFQAIDVFGTSGAGIGLNVFISGLFWALFAYIVYRIILMAIPFVGG